jgi:hypothetical protein
MKKDQMTWEAAGTLAGGRGKECAPAFHTANPRRVPSPHADHAVRVMDPECVTALFAGHFPTARRSATSVVIASGSIPLSPGL